MDRTSVLLLVLLGVLLAAAALLAAAETALVRMRGARARALQEELGQRGERVARLVEDLDRVLPAVLLAALLVQVVAASVASVLAGRWFGQAAVTWSALVLTAVLFVYTELLPKDAAVRSPGPILVALALPVRVVTRVLRPAVTGLRWLADLHVRRRRRLEPSVTERELRLMAREAAMAGQIDPSDRQLIEAAFRFGDREAASVMVPRRDIVSVAAEGTIDEALDRAVESGHRRIVVHGGASDEVLGYVHLSDLVHHRRDRSVDLRGLARVTLFVPESKPLVDLLAEMQREWIHLAIVVDEFGEVAGLVTIEDLAEVLLGQLTDETTRPDPAIRPIGEGRWLLDADVPLEDLERATGLTLAGDKYRTVGGLALATAGRLLRRGDTVEGAGWQARVVQAAARRLIRVEFRLSDPGPR